MSVARDIKYKLARILNNKFYKLFIKCTTNTLYYMLVNLMVDFILYIVL